ncbi:hypothetical protein AAP_05159 [Ascosphaera apis ARSEF 7405]|uniref:Uncharacterized protein n=1 Tax=Ascosphaera apis ARSEF 7405 TaxID=392613 RepID=A0A167VWF5_9EURO|nr:hypothetical protein AAP_05159 [Ascosphaera apis ARSEF 7405]
MDGGDIEWELDRASSIKHATLESNDGDDSQERPLSSSSRRSSQENVPDTINSLLNHDSGLSQVDSQRQISTSASASASSSVSASEIDDNNNIPSTSPLIVAENATTSDDDPFVDKPVAVPDTQDTIAVDSSQQQQQQQKQINGDGGDVLEQMLPFFEVASVPDSQPLPDTQEGGEVMRQVLQGKAKGKGMQEEKEKEVDVDMNGSSKFLEGGDGHGNSQSSSSSSSSTSSSSAAAATEYNVKDKCEKNIPGHAQHNIGMSSTPSYTGVPMAMSLPMPMPMPMPPAVSQQQQQQQQQFSGAKYGYPSMDTVPSFLRTPIPVRQYSMAGQSMGMDSSMMAPDYGSGAAGGCSFHAGQGQGQDSVGDRSWSCVADNQPGVAAAAAANFRRTAAGGNSYMLQPEYTHHPTFNHPIEKPSPVPPTPESYQTGSSPHQTTTFFPPKPTNLPGMRPSYAHVNVESIRETAETYFELTSTNLKLAHKSLDLLEKQQLKAWSIFMQTRDPANSHIIRHIWGTYCADLRCLHDMVREAHYIGLKLSLDAVHTLVLRRGDVLGEKVGERFMQLYREVKCVKNRLDQFSLPVYNHFMDILGKRMQMRQSQQGRGNCNNGTPTKGGNVSSGAATASATATGSGSGRGKKRSMMEEVTPRKKQQMRCTP